MKVPVLDVKTAFNKYGKKHIIKIRMMRKSGIVIDI